MKRINLTQARKQLEELKSAQKIQDSVTLIIASPEPDGKIRAVIHRGKPSSGKHEIEYFISEDALEALPGINESTVFIWADLLED